MSQQAAGSSKSSMEEKIKYKRTFIPDIFLHQCCPHYFSTTVVSHTSLPHISTTLFSNASLRPFSSNSFLQHFSTTLLLQHSSPTLLYNHLLQHSSPTLLNNTSLQRNLSNTSLRHSSPALLYTTSLLSSPTLV